MPPAFGHAEAFQTFFHGRLPLRHLVKPRNEIKVFLDGQVFVKGKFLSHVADALFDLGRFAAEIEAEAVAAAGVRLEQAAEHPQKRGFAAAIGAEEAVNLAGPHLHRNVIDDRARAEFFSDTAHVDGKFAGAHGCGNVTSTGWPGRNSTASARENLASIINTRFARVSRL